MSDTEVCVVFRHPATLMAVDDVAYENGWKEVEHFRRAERRLEELVYELPDDETVVRGIDDHFVIVVFAAISGPARAEAEQKLRAAGRALEWDTIWQWTKSENAKERAFALRAFAATSQPAADPRVVAVYQAALEDKDPIVRAALIESVGRAAWPELWPVVDALAVSGDADSMVLKEGYEKYLPRAK